METSKREEKKKDKMVKKKGRPSIIGAKERTLSVGNIEEFLRRKKERSGKKDEVEAFKKSKITIRSPEKERNVEERIDDLKRKINEMKETGREKMESCLKKEFMKWKAKQREKKK